MSIDNVLNNLVSVKSRGNNKWFALCPVHNEKTGSLSIKVDDNGAVLMHCFGCGAGAVEIIGELGLDISELWPERARGINGSGAREARKKIWSAQDRLEGITKEAVMMVMLAEKIIRDGCVNEELLARMQKAQGLIIDALHYGLTDGERTQEIMGKFVKYFDLDKVEKYGL